uniref:Uncharacterized protein n=1 Tax=Romanomermis culicivorax TaxID=13658 RepID=A0A915HUC1_ROMCU
MLTAPECPDSHSKINNPVDFNPQHGQEPSRPYTLDHVLQQHETETTGTGVYVPKTSENLWSETETIWTTINRTVNGFTGSRAILSKFASEASNEESDAQYVVIWDLKYI